ncbi:basic amino acid ABC transporter substrate-binding protein [Haloparvum sp. PAK95]|uniref:basic amino acid ABC transporter substrate-binding protein n=1 Tax=Haloparvum sp. PAK95 TaxID=3418962 RepID=UPI003D2EAC99
MTREFTSDVSRRTYLKLTGASSVAGLSATAGCIGGGDDTQTITPGTAPGFAPFEMKKDGELVGFDVDLLEAVVAETDYELDDWQEIKFDSLIPALTNERIDVIAAAMTINAKRKERIAFSDPYWESDQSILVREGGDFQPGDWSDFEGKTVGAQSGTTGAGLVDEELIKPEIISKEDFSTYDSYVFAVEDLENENIDAVVIDQPVAKTFAAERDVEAAFVHETNEQFGFGLRQGESELQTALNEGLAAVKEDGTYDELTKTWFGE